MHTLLINILQTIIPIAMCVWFLFGLWAFVDILCGDPKSTQVDPRPTWLQQHKLLHGIVMLLALALMLLSYLALGPITFAWRRLRRKRK